MGLQNASILVGSTLSATGGTALTFSLDGQQVSGGIHVSDAATTDFRVRPNFTAKTKIPTVDSLGVYSKGKRSLTFVRPKILASGKTVFPLVRIELEDHPEMTQAEVDALISQGAQLLFDADCTAYWRTGSLG